MEGKGAYTILLAVNAVLALALAVLVIFLFVTWGPNHNTSTGVETVAEERIVPNDELEEFDLYPSQEPYFTLKSEPEHPDAIIMLNISIKCDIGKKGGNLEEVTKLVNEDYTSELKEEITKYFAEITYSEAKQVETQYKAKDDLKQVFNEILNSGRKEKEPIVYKVITEKWFVQ